MRDGLCPSVKWASVVADWIERIVHRDMGNVLCLNLMRAGIISYVLYRWLL